MRLRLFNRGPWKVFAVCSDGGRCHLKDFLENLGPNLRGDGNRFFALLLHVSQNGPPRNSEINHKVADEIWQLTQGDLRILYFFDEGRTVVCVHGLIKKSQKTNFKDIAVAQEIRKRYFQDKKAGSIMIEEE